jgi:hypothetical protein
MADLGRVIKIQVTVNCNYTRTLLMHVLILSHNASCIDEVNFAFTVQISNFKVSLNVKGQRPVALTTYEQVPTFGVQILIFNAVTYALEVSSLF